ncbi:MAG: NMD3-related protein, partial [Candidatus Heimdallarchaeota archaeon]|nr:NMD3-related protein [Candidatus Heimdallarchaeota archaeon]
MNTGRFCADCGSTQVPLFENFCQECYWKIHSLGKLKRDYIEIPLCLICNAVKLSSGWTGSNQVDEIPEILAYAHLKLLQSDEDTISNIFEIDDIPWGNSNPVFQIYYNLTYDGITEFTTHTETFTLTLKLVGGNCSLCIRKKTGSGESTVQFRAKNRNLAPEEEDIATNIAFALVAEKENESPDAYLADVYESYGGLDFSFG